MASNYASRVAQTLNRVLWEPELSIDGFPENPVQDALWNRRQTLDGGRILEIGVAKIPNTTTVVFDDNFGTNSNQTQSASNIPTNFANLAFDWVNFGTPVAVSRIEAAKHANSDAALFKYMKTTAKLAVGSHKEKMSRSLMLDAAGSSPTTWDGLASAISNNGSSVYGGETRRDIPATLSVVLDGSDVEGTETTTAGFAVVAGTNKVTKTGHGLTPANGVELEVVDTREKRSVVGYDADNIYVNQIFQKTDASTSITTMSAFRTASKFGGANVFDIVKIDEGHARAFGKSDTFICDPRTLANFRRTSGANELAMTEDERKRIGFSDLFGGLRYMGGRVFGDEHATTGDVIGIPIKEWEFAVLKGFGKMALEESSSYKAYDSASKAVFAVDGMELVTVAALGCGKLHWCFKVTNLTK